MVKKSKSSPHTIGKKKVTIVTEKDGSMSVVPDLKRSGHKRKSDSTNDLGSTTEDDPSHSLLSEELREELGLDGEGGTSQERLVLSGSKHKKERKDTIEVSMEDLKKYQKLSRSKQKRYENILRRKEKEERQGEFIAKMQEYAISDQERSLMVSHKEAGQTITTKQLLAKTYRKYKAGLALSDEEHALLFPESHENSTDNNGYLSKKPRKEGKEGKDSNGVDESNASTSTKKGHKDSKRKNKAVEKDNTAAVAMVHIPETDLRFHNIKDSKYSSLYTAKQMSHIDTQAYGSRGNGEQDASNDDKKDVDDGGTALDMTAFMANPNPTLSGAHKSMNKGDKEASNALRNKKKNEKKKAKKDRERDIIRAANGIKSDEDEEGEEGDSDDGGDGGDGKNSSKEGKGSAKGVSGLGSSLMSQFSALSKNLPQKGTTTPGGSSTVEDTGVGGNSDDSDDGDDNNGGEGHVDGGSDDEGQDGEEAPRAVYVKESLVLPVMDGTLKPLPLSASTTSALKGTTSGGAGIEKRAVLVSRTPEIGTSRSKLPVVQMEQEIVETICTNDITIVCGETGSGKSTQIPQFLYEYGYGHHGMIGITQPRRVAAVSTAQRVAVEMNLPYKDKTVGYQIRHDASTVHSKYTKIKYCTDGILLNEIMTDLLLSQYSVIMIDEAHERNVNTDVLIGMLSRSVPLRKQQAAKEKAVWASLPPESRSAYRPPLQPLRVVIMSATLRVSDFLQPSLFTPLPPVINVTSRQFKVETHFSKRTETKHYLKEVHRKVMQIHQRLPPGAVLVFLTGKREILQFVRKCRSNMDKIEARHASRLKRLENEIQKVQQEGEGGGGETEVGNLNSNNDSTGDDEEKGDEGGDRGDFGGLDEDELFADEHVADGEDDEDDDIDIDELDFYDKSATLGGESGSDSNDSDSDDDSIHDNNEDAKEGADESAVEKGKEMYTESDLLRESMLRQALGTTAAHAPVANVATSAMKDDADNEGGEESGDEGDDDKAAKKDKEDRIAELMLQKDSIEEERPTRALILPLYAMMTPEAQARVFKLPPKGTRLIVVATNIAETSITIPGVRYVVDPGRHKAKTRDMKSGITKFEVSWISQAAAEQRKGRAGRTGPGHVYRLYSSTFFDQHMTQFNQPDILSTPLESLVLTMRNIGIRDITNFPFPTPPPTPALRAAMAQLYNIGAIVHARVPKSAQPAHMAWLMQGANKQGGNKAPRELVSKIGVVLTKFAISPRFAKMIIIGHYSNLLREALTLVACMVETNPFLRGKDEEKVTKSSEKSSGRRAKKRAKTKADDGDDDSDDDSEDDSEEEEEEEEDKQEEYQFDQDRERRLQESMWYHPQGDGYARLRTLGAYAYTIASSMSDQASKNQDQRRYKRKGAAALSTVPGTSIHHMNNENLKKFCEKHRVQSVVMNRTLELRYQLLKQCIQVFNMHPSDYGYDTNALKDSNEWMHASGKSSDPSISTPEGTTPSTEDKSGKGGPKKEAANPVLSACRDIIRSPPPSHAREKALGQLLLSGLCDHLARKVPPGTIQTGRRRQRMCAYISCNPLITGYLYIHPQSALYHPDPAAILPEFVLFEELTSNEKGDMTYMSNVNIVEPAWISSVCVDSPLLKWQAPLESPPPSYDVEQDVIKCYTVPKYGHGSWELPPVHLEMSVLLGYLDRDPQNDQEGQKRGSDDMNMQGMSKAARKIAKKNQHNKHTIDAFSEANAPYRFFVRYLLEAKLPLPGLSSVFSKDKLKDSPSVITNCQPLSRVLDLVRAFIAKDVCSVRKLKEVVRAEEQWGSEELQAMVKVDYRKEFRKVWSKVGK